MIDVPGRSASVTPVDIHVGKVMRIIRRAKRISQEDLAEALGISFQQVQKYELGRNRVSASKLFDAGQALGVAPAAFFEGLEGASDSQIPQALFDFLVEDGAAEIAESYLRLTPTKRRALVAVAIAMAD